MRDLPLPAPRRPSMLLLLLLALAHAAPAAVPADTPVVTVVASAASAGETARQRERSLARLETLRSESGAGALALAEPLATSASLHADYLALNGTHSTSSLHAETPGLAGFSGADPFARMRAAGYRSSYATELIGSAGPDGDCVDVLMDTVYHASQMLSRVTEVGLAYADGVAAGTCVIDLAAPLGAPQDALPGPRGLVRLPWPGMRVATGTFHPNAENPRPAPGLLPGATAGIPVLVSLRNVGDLPTPRDPAPIAVQQFELRDERNAEVPAVRLADPVISGPGLTPDRLLHGVFVVLVPRVPLRPGTYRVLFHATLQGGRAIAPAPWTFTVGAP